MSEGSKLNFLARIFPTKADDPETRVFKNTVFALVGMGLLMTFAAIAIFFVALQGQEETMVPDLVGTEMAQAVEELTRKDLYPRIVTQFTADPREKNTVISQDPQPGLLVKAGRRVNLRVSLGTPVDKVADYRSQMLSVVRQDLRKLAAGQAAALVEIDEAKLQYQYSQAPTGSIITQSPAPGSEISGTTKLVFVVSRGPKGQTFTMTDLIGKTYTQALEELYKGNLGANFTIQSGSTDQAGKIIAQDPAPGAASSPDVPVRLTVVPPSSLGKDQVFGVFETTIANYAILVDLNLEIKSASGQPRVAASLRHPGGTVSIPYLAQKGETLILKMYGRELATQSLR